MLDPAADAADSHERVLVRWVERLRASRFSGLAVLGPEVLGKEASADFGAV